MGANLDFIASQVVGHVIGGFDNAQIAAALEGCSDADCDVRTYEGPTPDWVRFFSHTARSPQGGFWWMFQLLGDDVPDDYPPPPPGVTAPFWAFSEEGAAVSSTRAAPARHRDRR